MMTDIPFGIAEIEGEAVTIAELNFAEVAAFTAFIPNHELLFALIRSLDFSGHTPPILAQTDEERQFVEHTMQGNYIPTSEDVGMASEVFGRWVNDVAPLGIQSLVEKGLLIPAENNSFKTHRSLDNIIRTLRMPVEHMSYRTTQVPTKDPLGAPILRSALYGVQSYAGDWVIAEHFQSHEYIRFVGIAGGTQLASKVGEVLSAGVAHSISNPLVSGNGSEFRPYSVIISRTNEHGASIITSAQATGVGKDALWYTPYPEAGDNKLLGSHVKKFGNVFSSEPGVAQMASAPYTQMDIRNGIEGWSLIGDNDQFVREVSHLTELTLHSQADHLPDTIPEYFFDENKGND
jgi:hypothetical protein